MSYNNQLSGFCNLNNTITLSREVLEMKEEKQSEFLYAKEDEEIQKDKTKEKWLGSRKIEKEAPSIKEKGRSPPPPHWSWSFIFSKHNKLILDSFNSLIY